MKILIASAAGYGNVGDDAIDDRKYKKLSRILK